MRAGTKNQKRVVQVNKSVKPIGKRIINWAKKNVLANYAIRYKSGTINCLKCGHHWKSKANQAWHDQITEVKCSSCKNVLKVEPTNKRTAEDSDYFSFVTKAKEYQLIRTFQIIAYYKCKEEAHYSINECFRVYINKDGKREVIAKLRSGGFYSWMGNWQGLLELRNPKVIDNKYAEQGALYDKWNLQDYVIKSGFDAYVYADSDFTVSKLLNIMLGLSNKLETIVKRNNRSLLNYTYEEPEKIKRYWATLRICFRRNFEVDSWRSYFDMIDALAFLGKDLRNPYYVCPKDFDKAHNMWIKRKWNKQEKIRKKQNETARLNRIAEEIEKAKEYNSRMLKFKDLIFRFGGLEIRPLMTIDDVKEAGNLMHHCIYKTVSYWQDADNLLLGSYYNGKLIETTQYNLERHRVLHSYGVLNKESKYHKKIVKIIKTGNHKIKDCLKIKTRKKTNSIKKVA